MTPGSPEAEQSYKFDHSASGFLLLSNLLSKFHSNKKGKDIALKILNDLDRESNIKNK